MPGPHYEPESERGGGVRLGVVSDVLGRERAIGLIRGVLEAEHGSGWGWSGPDGLAVKILLALDHPPSEPAPVHRKEGKGCDTP